MASSRKVQIRVEFPQEIAKLTTDEANRLKAIFSTEAAGILSGKVKESLLTTIIRNTKPKPGGGGNVEAAAAGKKTARRATTKKSAKKR